MPETCYCSGSTELKENIMSRFLSLSLTMLVAIVAMVATSAYANAQAMRWNPLINDIVKEAAVDEDGAIIKVQRRGGQRRTGNRRGGNRNYNRGGRNRNYNRGGRNRNYKRSGRRHGYYRGGRRYGYGRNNGFYGNFGYFPGIAIGLGYGAVGYNSYYRRDRGYGGDHVSWCLGRYRSYKPRTNTFRGYDGRDHRCRSPYRR
jgi:hypothetical protein